MKNLTVIILLMLFLQTNIAFAINTPAEPDFREFCPEKYYHKEMVSPEDIKKPVPKGVVSVGYILLGFPGVLMNKYNSNYQKKTAQSINSTTQYWQNREKSFKENIELCKKSNDVAYCYVQMKQNESELNAILEQNKLIQGMTAEMMYMNQNMYNMRNNINSPYYKYR